MMHRKSAISRALDWLESRWWSPFIAAALLWGAIFAASELAAPRGHTLADVVVDAAGYYAE